MVHLRQTRHYKHKGFRMTSAQSYTYPTSSASKEIALAFVIRRELAKVRTTTLAEVLGVTNSGSLSPIGTLTIRILVEQTDAAGNIIPAGTIYNVPYCRLAGGKNAVILDPEVGDIGVVGFGDRDLSKVLAAGGRAGPGSSRRHHWSDAIWVNTLPLNVTPDQYLQFNNSGVTLVTPAQFQAVAENGTNNPPTVVMNASGVTLTFGGYGITIDSSGIHFNGPVTGDSTAEFTGEGTFNGGHTVSAHDHAILNIQTGTSTVTSQPPTG